MTATSMETRLAFLSATEALALFRTREISPVDLLDAHIERINRNDRLINAISEQRFDAARAEARAAEDAYRSSGKTLPALLGIPTLLKNEHTMVGLHTTCGSYLLGDEPDAVNAPVVERLLEAGAVIHGQTNVPEFYLATFTRSKRHGITRNPWNPAITPGGSSGGSGAALAAGMTVLATASDIAGSARIPAAYCGVVGLKPSYGRIPEGNFFYALNPYSHPCLMTRSVVDAALLFNVLNGPHPADPATVRPAIVTSAEPADVRGVRIALSYDLGCFKIGEDVRRNTRRVAEALQKSGAIVEEVGIEWRGQTLIEVFTHTLGFLLRPALIAQIAGREDRVNDYVRSFLRKTDGITPEMFYEATVRMAEIHTALRKVFDHHDVLLCPTVADADTPAEGMADAHDNLSHKSLTYPFNLMSRHPVLAVPSGRADNGVPTGVQIVGQTFDEPTVLRVGAAIERLLPWSYPVLQP